MGTFEAVVICGQNQFLFSHPDGFGLAHVKKFSEHLNICVLEIIEGPFYLAMVVHIPVSDLVIPFKVVYIVYLLYVHGDALDAIRQFTAYGVKVDAAALLEVCKLRYFHTIEPDLPSEPPGAQCGRFPVIFNKPYIMIEGVYAETPQRVEVEILYIEGGGLQYYLILIVVLQPVWILSISSVGGSSGRFNIRNVPRFGTKRPKKRCGVEGTGSYLKVVRLLNDASIVRPVLIEGEYQFLKVHRILLSYRPP